MATATKRHQRKRRAEVRSIVRDSTGEAIAAYGDGGDVEVLCGGSTRPASDMTVWRGNRLIGYILATEAAEAEGPINVGFDDRNYPAWLAAWMDSALGIAEAEFQRRGLAFPASPLAPAEGLFPEALRRRHFKMGLNPVEAGILGAMVAVAIRDIDGPN